MTVLAFALHTATFIGERRRPLWKLSAPVPIVFADLGSFFARQPSWGEINKPAKVAVIGGGGEGVVRVEGRRGPSCLALFSEEETLVVALLKSTQSGEGFTPAAGPPARLYQPFPISPYPP